MQHEHMKWLGQVDMLTRISRLKVSAVYPAAHLPQWAEPAVRPLPGCPADTGFTWSCTHFCLPPSVSAHSPGQSPARVNTATKHPTLPANPAQVEARLDRGSANRTLRIALFQVLTLCSVPLPTRVIFCRPCSCSRP